MVKNKNKPLFAFAIIIIVVIVIIISSSVFSFIRYRKRYERFLEDLGLNTIVSFETSLRVGLQGVSVWNDRKLHKIISQTCEKNKIKIQSFSIVFPSLRVYEVS